MVVADGYGSSENRDNLRLHIEADRFHIGP
jgi:hypothetical protein